MLEPVVDGLASLLHVDVLLVVVPDVFRAVRLECLFCIGVIAFWTLSQHIARSTNKDRSAPPKNRAADSADATSAATRRAAGSNANPLQAEVLRNKTKWLTVATAATETKQSPKLAQLRDAAWLFPLLMTLCNVDPSRAVATYREALSAGLDLQRVSRDGLEQILMALVISAARVGNAKDTLWLLRDLGERGLQPEQSLRVSVAKLCMAKQAYQECLAVDNCFTVAVGPRPADRNLLSCLLFSAVECQEYSLCLPLFKELKTTGRPSQKDYWNMIRFASCNSDWMMMLELISDMRDHALEIDNFIYNTALATCVSADRMDAAQSMLEEMSCVGGVTDVITYNTVMKGYAKLGDVDNCFKLYDAMLTHGFEPSSITCGILLDVCINDSQLERASEIFNSMSAAGCAMNTVIYTTMIKGFARAGKVDDAMRIYSQMAENDAPADLITYSVLLKANCDAGRLEVALFLLRAMQEANLQPDEVIFNNVLAGCGQQGNLKLAKMLYQDMVTSGVRPSSATFSIFIRLYSQCEQLQEAVDMIRTEPALHKIRIEPRIYFQLMQSCIRSRQGKRAVDVYERWLDDSQQQATFLSGSALGMCVKLNMFETAVELLEVAAARGARVEARDAQMVLDGALRKRKTHCAELCAAAMRSLGIQTDEA